MFLSYCKFFAFIVGQFAVPCMVAGGVFAAGLSGLGGPMNVVVSTPALGTLVERIGGDGVAVEVLAGAGRNHETFAPSPRQLARVAGADLYFSNDLPFEKVFLPRLQSVAPNLPVINTVGLVKRIGSTAAPCCEHDHGHDHDHGPEDPHLWLSPSVLRAQIAAIADALEAKLGEVHREGVLGRADVLVKEVDLLEGKITEQLEGMKGAVFLINHPALGYFARDFGLRQLSLEAEGRQPSPARIASELRRAREEGVRVVFTQAGFSRSAASLLARELGVPEVEFDPMAADPFAEIRRLAGAFEAGN